MTRGVHLFLAGLAVVAASTPTAAQDNLDRGRSPQQLFNTNCAICHPSPQGLGMALGSWTLSGFLAQHYTTSAAAADTLARYIAFVNRGADAKQSRPRKERPGRKRRE